MSFWSVWQFLTTIPPPVRVRYGPEQLGKSVMLFPLVGLVLGVALLGLDRLLELLLPAMASSALVVVALIALTGALHLDGLVDTCDGFAVKGSRQQRLDAMRDSRVGGFGVIGGAGVILLKFASLASLSGWMRGAALLLMPVLSRWAMVYAITGFRSARSDGLGWTAKQASGGRGLALATTITVAASVAVLSYWGVALMAVLSVLCLVACRSLQSSFGGLTGDSYGAVNETAEVAVLLLVLVAQRAGVGGCAWPLSCWL
ncbi:MAG: adenosylcobinamide-GDP ribazoletransferase [Chloroflexota bacterium]